MSELNDSQINTVREWIITEGLEESLLTFAAHADEKALMEWLSLTQEAKD